MPHRLVCQISHHCAECHSSDSRAGCDSMPLPLPLLGNFLTFIIYFTLLIHYIILTLLIHWQGRGQKSGAKDLPEDRTLMIMSLLCYLTQHGIVLYITCCYYYSI